MPSTNRPAPADHHITDVSSCPEPPLLVSENTAMIHVIATVELNEGTRSAFLQEFAKVLPQVRAESGCIEYGAAVDLAASLGVPTPQRGNVVLILEKWHSLEALQSHLGAAHMQAYRTRVKDFVNRVSLQVLEPVTLAE